MRADERQPSGWSVLTSGGPKGRNVLTRRRRRRATKARRAEALEILLFLIVFILACSGNFFLEVVYGAAGFGYEAAHVSGHLGEGTGAEDYQEDDAYYQHLLGPDA